MEARAFGFTDVNDPNNQVNIKDAYHPQDRTHIIKFNGTYIFPKDVTVSANYRFYTGQPLTRLFQVVLNQGFTQVAAEPRGTFRYPDVSILDLRVSKIFKFNNWSLEGMFNIFNALNSDAVVNQITTLGPFYGTPSQLLSPRIVGIGVRATF